MGTFHFDDGLAGVFVSLSDIELVFCPENILVADNFDSQSVILFGSASSSNLADARALVGEGYTLTRLGLIEQRHVVVAVVRNRHVLRFRKMDAVIHFSSSVISR